MNRSLQIKLSIALIPFYIFGFSMLAFLMTNQYLYVVFGHGYDGDRMGAAFISLVLSVFIAVIGNVCIWESE